MKKDELLINQIFKYQSQLKYYRIGLIIFSIGLPLIGLTINILEKRFYDPIILRIILSFITFSFVLSSYKFKFVINNFSYFLNTLFAIIVLWISYIAFRNNFIFSATFFYITVISIISFTLHYYIYVAIFSVSNFLLIIVLLSFSTIPVSDKFTILTAVFFIQVVAYLVVRLKNIAETELIESEQKYRLLAENISDVIWIYNLSLNRITYISPSVAQLTGYTHEEIQDISLKNIFMSETFSRIQNEILKKVERFMENSAEKQSSYYEIQQKCKNGRWIWTEVTTSILKNSKGEIEINGVSRNIDKRKQVEIQLQKYIAGLNYTGNENINKDQNYSRP